MAPATSDDSKQWRDLLKLVGTADGATHANFSQLLALLAEDARWGYSLEIVAMMVSGIFTRL